MINHFFYLAIALLVCSGAIVLLWTVFSRKISKNNYSAIVFKSISEVPRLLAAVLAAATQVATAADMRVWCLSALAASYFFWLVASYVVDFKKAWATKGFDVKEKEFNAQISVLNRRLDNRVALLLMAKEVMAKKKQIVWRMIDLIEPLTNTKRRRINSIADALNPPFQALQLAQQLALFLRAGLPPSDDREKQNFRVAFYVSQGSNLQPYAEFDLERQSERFLRAFREDEPRFRLDCEENPSCAVRCLLESRTIVIENTEKEPDAFFSHTEQKIYLKSMVAYPIMGFGNLARRVHKACIVIDTNVPDHFRSADLPSIEAYLEQFAVRLDLEFAVGRLITLQVRRSTEESDE